MAVIGITGPTDGIGRPTARVLLATGAASWFTHAVGSGGTRCESIGWRRRFGGSAADTSVSATPGCWLAVLDTSPLGAAGQRAPVTPEDGRDVRMAAPVLVAWVAFARWSDTPWIARHRRVRRVRLGCSSLSRAVRAGAWFGSASTSAACRAADRWPWLLSSLPGCGVGSGRIRTQPPSPTLSAASVLYAATVIADEGASLGQGSSRVPKP